MVEDKDVVLAIFGGSVGVTSILLVFLGFLVSAYGSLPNPGTTEKTRAWYRETSRLVLLVLFVNIASTLLALTWLLGAELYAVVVGAFVLSLGLVGAIAAFVTLRLVR